MNKVMLSLVVCSVVMLSAFGGAAPVSGAEPTPGSTAGPEYLLGPGDVLFISVWKDETLTRTLPVRPDGMITFPLIGELPAGGRSAVQLQSEIEKKIARFVPEPFVTVSVQDIRSLMVYVIGRVNSPGRFAVTGNVDVLQALAMAGGCNPFADTKNIRVFRKDGSKTLIMDFNYNEVSTGKSLDQNIMLERGDVIVVP